MNEVAALRQELHSLRKDITEDARLNRQELAELRKIMEQVVKVQTDLKWVITKVDTNAMLINDHGTRISALEKATGVQGWRASQGEWFRRVVTGGLMSAFTGLLLMVLGK